VIVNLETPNDKRASARRKTPGNAQRDLTKVDDPIGPENDAHIIQMARKAAIVIFAHGTPKHKQLRSRGLSQSCPRIAIGQ
jgi:hypothetical protein